MRLDVTEREKKKNTRGKNNFDGSPTGGGREGREFSSIVKFPDIFAYIYSARFVTERGFRKGGFVLPPRIDNCSRPASDGPRHASNPSFGKTETASHRQSLDLRDFLEEKFRAAFDEERNLR